MDRCERVGAIDGIIFSSQINQWRPYGRKLFNNDVALIKLEKPVKLSDKVNVGIVEYLSKIPIGLKSIKYTVYMKKV